MDIKGLFKEVVESVNGKGKSEIGNVDIKKLTENSDEEERYVGMGKMGEDIISIINSNKEFSYKVAAILSQMLFATEILIEGQKLTNIGSIYLRARRIAEITKKLS